MGNLIIIDCFFYCKIHHKRLKFQLGNEFSDSAQPNYARTVLQLLLLKNASNFFRDLISKYPARLLIRIKNLNVASRPPYSHGDVGSNHKSFCPNSTMLT